MSVSVRRLDPGQTFVWGKTPEMARTLLDAATAAGVQQEEVRAVNQGFIVPDAVWDRVKQPDPPSSGGAF